MLGLPADEIAIDWGTVVLNMLTIKGIYGREMFETWYSMSVMLERGLDLTPVITHRFGYADFERAFDVARQGQCGKVILDWTDCDAGGEALMFGRMRDDLTTTIGEIRDAGLYKSERVITSPQHAVHLGCLRQRGAELLREQLPRPGRPPRGDRRGPGRAGPVGLRDGVGALHLRHPGRSTRTWKAP